MPRVAEQVGDQQDHSDGEDPEKNPENDITSKDSNPLLAGAGHLFGDQIVTAKIDQQAHDSHHRHCKIESSEILTPQVAGQEEEQYKTRYPGQALGTEHDRQISHYRSAHFRLHSSSASSVFSLSSDALICSIAGSIPIRHPR